MSTEENEALVRRFWEIFNSVQGDIDRLTTAPWDSIFSSDYVMHFTTRDMTFDQFIQYNAVLFTAFPDTYFTIDDMITEEDKVVTRYTMKGTFEKEYMGISPTGKQCTIKGASIDRIDKCRIVETWDYPDMLSALIQLGVIPDFSSRI